MRGLGLLGCACLALALPACGPSVPKPAKRLPNVLLVVVDTLRADRLEHLGSERGATPFLDELARGGTAFRRAYSTASWTPPAVASLFTSRLPVQHGIRRDDSVLAQAEVTLAERLTAAGYQTIGFSANLRIRVELGYGQGFDRWFTYIENPDGSTKPRAAQITSDALAWLERRPASEDRPVFLYLQFLEPHSPYEPPEPYRSRFQRPATPEQVRIANEKLTSLRFDDLDADEIALLESLYDGEVAYLDAELAKLFAELERRGFLDDAIVVVTSDHGEEFHEHGALLHGATLFEAGVRVPLILIAPRVARGRKVDVPVSLVDVSATILDLVGVPRPTQFEGASLLPLSGVQAEKTGGAERGPVLFDLPPKGGFDVRVHEWGGVDGDEKLLIERDGTGVVLDLARDPGESAPRSTVDDARGAELSRRLARRRAQLARSAGPEARRTALDAETRKQLEALGYAVDESGD